MSLVTTTFTIPESINAGLSSGIYERVGGVIRHSDSKKVVSWLREVGQQNSGSLPMHPLIGTANLLNLGVSTIGFAVIANRLNQIQQSLLNMQKILESIERKIDLGYLAKFQTATQLVINALTMNKRENRNDNALSAIEKFLDVEHIYAGLIDHELQEKSCLVDNYLLILAFAYVAEARCYLEIEELGTASRRLQEGASVIRPRFKNYVEMMLTTNPAAYLDSRYKGQISLSRITDIYRYFDTNLDENLVFENLRDSMLKWPKDKEHYKWCKTLPLAIVNSKEIQGSMWGNDKETTEAALDALPEAICQIERMFETSQRFETYQSEIEGMERLNIPFQEWKQLSPLDKQPSTDNSLMFIVPEEPVAVS